MLDQQLENPEGLQQASLDWLDVAVDRRTADQLSLQWCQRGNKYNTSAGPLMWLKLRVMERYPLPRSGATPTDICCHTLLHIFDIYGTIGVGVKSDEPIADSLSRPAIGGCLYRITPVNRVAQRVSGWNTQVCPHCGKTFRNTNACGLHVTENHVTKRKTT